MNEIYVIGHHNPDTDSIVSAMAYAALRNALGDRNYVAAHMDNISDQTLRMLDRSVTRPRPCWIASASSPPGRCRTSAPRWRTWTMIRPRP